MANLKNITELPLAESAEGVNLWNLRIYKHRFLWLKGGKQWETLNS